MTPLGDPIGQELHGPSFGSDSVNAPQSLARPSGASPQHAGLTLLQCIYETAHEAPMEKVLTGPILPESMNYNQQALGIPAIQDLLERL